MHAVSPVGQSRPGDETSPLERTGLLDSPAEPVFDQLTSLVAKILKVRVALMSLVDLDRQFFKSQCGLPEPVATARETPLSHSFCQHVASHGEPLIINDARLHPLVMDNPAVSELGVVAYAGMPLTDADGHTLGALCAIDDKPRSWTPEELDILRALAGQVMTEVGLRSTTFQLGQDVSQLRQDKENTEIMARLDRHDLRTPLNALSLNLQAIRLTGSLTETQAQCLASAERNSRILTTMIDNMLDVANINHRGADALTRQFCAPMELISLAVDQVAPLAKQKGIQIEREDTPALPLINADKDKILRTLVNLLDNAVKFSHEGGFVRITIKHRRNDGHNTLIFWIKDQGIGIAENDVNSLFTEGFRVDKKAPTRRSTGLGLSFCKRVVEAHQGRIWVDSILGQGSTFAFAIPLEEN